MDSNFLSENVDLRVNDVSNKPDSLDNSMDQRALSEDLDIETNNSCSEMETLDNSTDQGISEEVDLEVNNDSSDTITLDNSMDEKSLSENADIQLTDIRIDPDALVVSDDCMGKMEQSNPNNSKEVTEFAVQDEECEEIDVVNINSPKVEKSLSSMNSEALVAVSDISEVDLMDESCDQKEPIISNVKTTVMVSQKDVEKEKRGDVELSPSKSNCDILEEDIEVKGKSDAPCITTSKPDSETTGGLLCNDTNISMQEQPSSSNTNFTVNERAPIEIDVPFKDINLEQKEIDPLVSDTSPMFTDDDDSQASPKTDMLEVLLEEDDRNGDFETIISDSTQSSKEGSKFKTEEESVSTESSIEVGIEVKRKESVLTVSLKEVNTEVEAEKEYVSAKSSKEVNTEIETEKEYVSAESSKKVNTEIETEKECVSAESSKNVNTEVETEKEHVSAESSKKVNTEVETVKEYVSAESSKKVNTEVETEKKHVCTESSKDVSTEVETENALTGKKSESMEEENNNAKQGLSEAEKESDRKKKQSLPKSFIEEFLSFSQGDTDGENRTSGDESQKALPLNRFPKIVKNVTKAEYPLLQELYKLLYLRNPWDTKEILAQRILEFSGFTFKQDSEDYYTREVILRTMPESNLEAIGTLLCIENIRSLSFDMSKSRHILVSSLMRFLSKPRRMRKSRPVMTLSNKQYRPRYPGPKCSKVKENVIDLDNEELENLREKILNGTSPQPKVLLKRIDLSVFCNFFAGAQGKGLQLGSQDNKPCLEEKEDEVQLEESDDDKLVELPKKKLKDFPKIVKEMEIFSEEMLLDIHFLLYSKGAEIKDLKANILEFTGFPFNSESEEYGEKREFLDKMNLDIVQSISKVFCLPFKKLKGSVINQILLFLQTLSEPTQEEKGKMSEQRKTRRKKNASDEDMSDSEGSITCEVVSKKVELIDLISSGEESGKEDSKDDASPRKGKKKRTLGNFETITKIVNTHPAEYLVDIFNLLYMKPCEAKTLREDILRFSGFKFDKSSPEHTKRKQFMDRMQYNSVRRVYNTLIHNSTEVKVFSKPVMNAEIFEFLFNLPETDTSIRRPIGAAAKPAAPAAPRQAPITNPTLQGILKGCHPFQNQAQAKLSDLKRVFQRVACFPCEYLVDVHKLLFMKECEMKDIRQNIFNFKGFDFDQNSAEFKQRKMYLEYLTFHSLRKISSVLTTRTVDLRNSTKHELANHLTQVLAEYTNVVQDKEQVTKEADKVGEISVIESPVSKKEEHSEEKPIHPLPTPKSKSTEEIVKDGKQKYSCGNDILDLRVTNSSSALEITIQSVPESKNDSKQVKLPVSKEITISAVKERKRDMPPKVQVPKMSYSKKAKTKYFTSSRGNVGSIPVTMLDSCKNYTKAVNQQLQPIYSRLPFPPPIPRARIFPVVHNFPPPINRLPNPKSNIFPDIRPNPEQVYQDYPSEDFDDYTVSLPVECILTEDSDNEPQAKKPKLMLQPQLHQGKRITTSNLILPESTPQERVDTVPQHSASFQMKIRNAMTKASEDEEDCDRPLAALVGHPNDKVLKQQICEIVEKTDLQEITINGVIQKIFALYPQFNLNYRKEFIKSTLRSLLYRLGEQDGLGVTTPATDEPLANSPDCSVSTTDPLENPIPVIPLSAPRSPSIVPVSLSHTLPISLSHPMPVPIGDLPNTVVLNKQHQKS